MPFNWDLNRIKEQNIFVHEEVKIPKIFSTFGDSKAFNATVNLKPVTGRSLAIDPFTEENNLILHYLLNKADLIKLAEAFQGKGIENMTFTLTPSEEKPIETTKEVVADKGGILTKLEWPNQVISNQDNELNLKFSDALTDSALNADVKYDIAFYDQNDVQTIKKEDLVAKNATDSQVFNFPEKGIYRMEIDVKAINYPGVTSPDETRNGLSRGTVVVS